MTLTELRHIPLRAQPTTAELLKDLNLRLEEMVRAHNELVRTVRTITRLNPSLLQESSD